MSSFTQMLKGEIARLSRRELRSQVEPLKKQSAAHRRHIAALKRQLLALERLVAELKRGNARALRASPPEGEEAKGTRFSAMGLRAMRAKRGFSAAELGKLLGVSGQSVYNWESQKSVPRKAQVAGLAGLRGLGKRAARSRIDALSAPKKRQARPAG
jgi:DNA-binding transcriptional regulator YiaG